jgi:hypothetical protein
MAAKSKAMFLALALSMLAPVSSPAQPSQAQMCLDIARMPIKSVTDGLKLFVGEVLGKEAELWQEKDFRILLANVQNCDGKPEGLDPKVSYFSWNLALNAIYPIVLEVTNVTVPIAVKYKGVFPTKGGEMLCTRIFDFRKDPVWLTNNSGEVFGVPFERMTAPQLLSARAFLSECQPVLAQILTLRNKNDSDAEKLVKSINTSIDRDQKIPQIHIDGLVEDLIPVRDGKVVPLAYVSPNTVSVVRRVNTSLLRKTRLRTDDLVLISKWADNVFELIPQGPDRAYAEKVKQAITREMFPG